MSVGDNYNLKSHTNLPTSRLVVLESGLGLESSFDGLGLGGLKVHAQTDDVNGLFSKLQSHSPCY